MTTIVNWVVYSVLTLLGIDIMIANATAWLLAAVFSFFANKFFVFKSKSTQGKILFIEFLKFMSSRAVTGLIEIFLPSVIMGIGLNQSITGVPGDLAKALTSIIVIILNYVFNKLIVFKKKEEVSNDSI